jgi:hypothetical protein
MQRASFARVATSTASGAAKMAQGRIVQPGHQFFGQVVDLGGRSNVFPPGRGKVAVQDFKVANRWYRLEARFVEPVG